jgi:hypothetical protein
MYDVDCDSNRRENSRDQQQRLGSLANFFFAGSPSAAGIFQETRGTTASERASYSA